jgi:hypothetical protein
MKRIARNVHRRPNRPQLKIITSNAQYILRFEEIPIDATPLSPFSQRQAGAVKCSAAQIRGAKKKPATPRPGSAMVKGCLKLLR